MLITNQRNRKISHLIEFAIHDFCKLLGCSYYTRDEAIMVQNDDEDLFYLYPEFGERSYNINIVCMIYQKLSISELTILRAIYKGEIVSEYLQEADTSFWFLDDTRLVFSGMNYSAASRRSIKRA